MKIKATNIVIALIFIATFNACWFTLVEADSATRWICYAVIHIAYALLWVSAYSIPNVKGGVVYGYPKIWVAYSYFFITLLFGIAIAAINPIAVTWPIVVFVIITGAHLLIYTFLMKSEEHSIASDRESAQNLGFIRNCSQQLQELMRQIPDANHRKQVEKVYDAIRNAQVTSTPQAAAIESQIVVQIEEIQAVIGDPGQHQLMINHAISLIRQRDSLIRMSR
jgi:hypothetical protein